jgi:hypothetical protein
VLWGGGLGQSLLGGGVDDSSELESVGDPGPGKWVTIYATAGHAYIEVAGVCFDTAAGLGDPPNPPPTGPRWSIVGTEPARFVARHPPGCDRHRSLRLQGRLADDHERCGQPPRRCGNQTRSRAAAPIGLSLVISTRPIARPGAAARQR